MVKFRSTVGLSNLVVVLFTAYVVLNVGSIASNVMQHQLLGRMARGQYTGQEAYQNDSRQDIIAKVSLAMFFLSFVSLLVWQFISNKNLRALGLSALVFTPLWAAGSYFIPIYNFWKPYQVMKELSKASRPLDEYKPDFCGLEWYGNPSSKFLEFWWGLVVLCGILNRVSGSIGRSTESIDGLQALTTFHIVIDAVAIAFSVLLILIVREITSDQSENYRLMREREIEETSVI